MMLALLACVSVASAESAPQSDSTSWPAQRQTPAGAAACRWEPTAPAPIPEWHFTWKGARRFKTGLAVWASPAVAIVNGRPMAFIGGCDQTLHALDLLSKEQIWFKVTNGEIGDAPAVADVRGKPAVFWGSSDRYVYACVAETGERLWSRELVAPTASQAPALMSAPLVHDGILYICCFVFDKAVPTQQQNGWLFALDAEKGRLLWRHEIAQGPLNAPAGRMLNGRFTLFVAARKGLLQAYAVSARGPEFLWKYQMPHEVLACPALEENTERPLLFLGSKFGDLIALDAATGAKRWRRMTGNWIDNNACVVSMNGENVVVVGSHDYSVYALRAADGSLLWRRALGGEVYSAPCAFAFEGGTALAAASLDNHLYVLNGTDGKVITSFFTGQPVWDKVTKGETLWGSPAAVAAGDNSVLVHGSYNGSVYVLPVGGETSLRAKARSSAALWKGLGVVFGVFTLIILPATLLVARRPPDNPTR